MHGVLSRRLALSSSPSLSSLSTFKPPCLVVKRFISETTSAWIPPNKLPLGFWDNENNRKEYLDWLGYKKLGYKDKNDFYHIRQSHFMSGGWDFVKRYDCVASKAVMDVYNDHEWKFWLFDQSPKEFWGSIENQKKYMDWLGESLGFKTMDDWYNIKIANFKHGWQLLEMYQNNAAKIVMTVYPQHQWQFWKFEPIPRGFWDDVKCHRSFVDWLGTQIGIVEWQDWYGLQVKDFSNRKASSLIARYNNSPFELLTKIYPEHPWDTVEYVKVQKKLANSPTILDDDYHKKKFAYAKPFQDDLRAIIQELFPKEDFMEEYIHMALFSREMVFDLYIPKVKLGFKYIPEIHYRRRRKNVLFHEACAQAGITLIDIPHWWDKKKQSLYGSIAKRNPSILPPLPDCLPIPRDPPNDSTNNNSLNSFGEKESESEIDAPEDDGVVASTPITNQA